MGEINQTPHLTIVLTARIGHLIPLTEFAKRLVSHHDFSLTFFIATDGSSTKTQETILKSLPSSIDYTFLPPVSFDDVPADVKIQTLISLTIIRSLPSLRAELKKLMEEKRVVAMVVDYFATDAFDVGMEFNLPCYVFYPSNFTLLSLVLELPTLDQKYSCEYRDIPEPVRLPGCVPLQGIDFVGQVQDRKNEAYKWLLHQAQRYKLAEGILVNSFMELEPGPVKELTQEKPGRPPVYPVGPLIRNSAGNSTDGIECLRWLDEQPHDSVLFISFGSEGALSTEQLTELAFGLEMSEQRFLWVVKSPTHDSNNPNDFLPKGFLERTKGVGLVVSTWVPQIQVLNHGATGGFLTHCGWNSTLESVVHGVPLIAWPLFAEQKMNAAMLDHMNLALRVKFDENGIVRREEITMVVKGLVEGEKGMELSTNMKQLKSAAANTLSEDGASTKSLSQVALKWKG